MPAANGQRNVAKKAPRGRLFRYGGFTLIELVAVLVIMGIVMAVVAPRFFDNATFSERGYADEIAASMRYARRIAVGSGCNVRFTVNAAGYSAAQPTVRCNTAGAWGVAVLSPDRRALANVTPTGVAVGAAVLEFRATGDLVNPVAALNVGAFSVSVDSTTGSVTVQ
jgi:MSHA pilin protein MshC